jgi:hypothetical protein
MELTSLSQYGLSAIFIFAAWKLYTDMRNDSTRRETALMLHLDKVADTLSDINERLCTVEKCVNKDGEK